jgi:hypothetical protein
MPIILASTTSTVTFKSMITEASPYLQGCPDYVIETTYRRRVEEICRRARVWRGALTDITLVPGTYTYAPASPLAYADVITVRSATTTISGSKRELNWQTYDAVQGLYPAWPENLSGTPLVFTRQDLASILLAPVPDTAGTLKTYGDLRPTDAATVWDSVMYSEHRDALFHGVLGTLMGAANRPWSDGKGALTHSKEWNFRLNSARIRADRDYNSGSISVQMRPLA